MAYDSKWWGMRSGDLVGSNTITQEISDAIKKFFSKKDGKSRDIFLVLFALTAFGFGIAGYTSLLVKFMPSAKAARIIIDLIPMGIGCYLFYLAFFNKFDSKVYMEAAAGLCIILMGYSLMSLSMDLGSFLSGSKFMIYWMIFSIPVIYLATSTVGAIIYLYILISWLGAAQILSMLMNPYMLVYGGSDLMLSGILFKTGHAVFGWFFLLLILPHFMRYTDRPSYDTRKMFLGWVGGYLIIWIAFNSFTQYGLVAGSFLMLCFYMAGKEYFADGAFWWNRPFQTMAIASTVTMSYILSVKYAHPFLIMSQGLGSVKAPTGWFAYSINALVVLGVIAWGAYTIYNDYKTEKKANMTLAAFPGVLVLTILIDWLGKSEGAMTASAWIFSLYTIWLGADYIMKGREGKSYQLVALGWVIMLPMALYRIFDLLKEAITGENILIVIGLILLGVCGAMLYFGMKFYNETRPAEEE